MLHRGYGLWQRDIAAALRAMLAAGKAAIDPGHGCRTAVFEAGGDFADGMTAYRDAGSVARCRLLRQQGDCTDHWARGTGPTSSLTAL